LTRVGADRDSGLPRHSSRVPIDAAGRDILITKTGLRRQADTQVSAFWTAAYFRDPEAARELIESKRWSDGAVCPKCGAARDRIRLLQGRSTRAGVYKCNECRQPFTVKIGTAFEASHIGLHLWLQAICLLAAPTGKTTIRDLEVILGVTRRTAWLLKRRISCLIAQEHAAVIEKREVEAAIAEVPASESEASVSSREAAEASEGRLAELPQLLFELPPEEHKVRKQRPSNRRLKRKSDPQPGQLELLPK
jgi:transposase-like protein